MDLLKQFNVKDLQAKYQEMQEQLKTLQASGTAGGGIVTIRMTGLMEVTQVEIAQEAVEDGDTEMLQDLVRAAFNAAMSNLKDKIQEETAGAFGGFPFPGRFPGQV